MTTVRADCELCEAARITPWFHEDDVCWIAECEICATPMVVWRSHGVAPPPEQLAHMHTELARVAATVFEAHYLDDNMRNIPDHYHAHARPVGGFFGHGSRLDRTRRAPGSRGPRLTASPSADRRAHRPELSDDA